MNALENQENLTLTNHLFNTMCEPCFQEFGNRVLEAIFEPFHHHLGTWLCQHACHGHHGHHQLWVPLISDTLIRLYEAFCATNLASSNGQLIEKDGHYVSQCAHFSNTCKLMQTWFGFKVHPLFINRISMAVTTSDGQSLTWQTLNRCNNLHHLQFKGYTSLSMTIVKPSIVHLKIKLSLTF